jgi:hypothetical protein
VVLLAVGVGRYGAERAAAAPSARPCAAEQSAPSAASVTQLRQEFDTLIAKNDARQIRVDEFGQGVKRIIADCQALLSRKDLPEPNAIHAQKLLADGYGAISEHQKEFEAYVALSIAQGRYYDAHPQEFHNTISKGLTTGQQASIDMLLWKAHDHRKSHQCLQAARYYAAIAEAFPRSEYAPLCFTLSAECYLEYDLPGYAERCCDKLMAEYPGSRYALELMRAHAKTLLEHGKWSDAANAWFWVAERAADPEESARCELIAAGIYIMYGEHAYAERALKQTLNRYEVFRYREEAMALVQLCRKEALRALLRDVKKELRGM